MGNTVHIDNDALQAFITESNTKAPHGQAVDTILQSAWRILVNAGVFVVTDIEVTNAKPEALPHLSLKMNDGHLFVDIKDRGKFAWTAEMPPMDGLIEALAYALATIFNTPPHTGPIPWPWSKN